MLLAEQSERRGRGDWRLTGWLLKTPAYGLYSRVSRFSQIPSDHCTNVHSTVGSVDFNRYGQIILGSVDFHRYDQIIIHSTVGSVDFHRYSQIIVQYTVGSVDFQGYGQIIVQYTVGSDDFHRYGQSIFTDTVISLYIRYTL